MGRRLAPRSLIEEGMGGGESRGGEEMRRRHTAR